MRYRPRFAALSALLMLAIASPLAAQDKQEASPQQTTRQPLESITRHSGQFGGSKMAYEAIAGEIFLKDKDGRPKAAIYSTTYLKTPRDATRPVVFLFNGGPGSGSLWLHLGAFGPKRVVVPSDARDDGAPPYPLVDNPHALLDVADLVFIDPVGTGFSHALPGTEAKEYWGVKSDAVSIAEFIPCGLASTSAGIRPNMLAAKAMAPLARLPWPMSLKAAITMSP